MLSLSKFTLSVTPVYGRVHTGIGCNKPIRHEAKLEIGCRTYILSEDDVWVPSYVRSFKNSKQYQAKDVKNWEAILVGLKSTNAEITLLQNGFSYTGEYKYSPDIYALQCRYSYAFVSKEFARLNIFPVGLLSNIFLS
jgi:hypothetical protein